MAQRGRKPDPPALKVLKANQARTIAAGPFAGLRQGGAPDKPETIASDEVASAEWDRLCSMLEDRRILSPADLGILLAYCSAFSTVVRCREILRPKKDPETGKVVDPYLLENEVSGVTKIHPAVGALSGAERSLVSFASELGITPTARGRVTTVEDVDKPESKLSRYIK